MKIGLGSTLIQLAPTIFKFSFGSPRRITLRVETLSDEPSPKKVRIDNTEHIIFPNLGISSENSYRWRRD